MNDNKIKLDDNAKQTNTQNLTSKLNALCLELPINWVVNT